MNREEIPGKSPEEMYIQQKVRVLLMLKKMGSNVRIRGRFTGAPMLVPTLVVTLVSTTVPPLQHSDQRLDV